MHAQNEVADRLKQVREFLEYTQTGMAAAIGSKMRSWQQYEAGNRMPGGQVFQGLAKLGINVNWILTGEGPRLIGESGRNDGLPNSAQDARQFGETNHGSADTLIDTATLADVFEALRDYQDRRQIRWQPRDEARIAAEIYQYLIEQDQPTAEDRARAIRLVTSVIEGMHAQSDTGEKGY